MAPDSPGAPENNIIEPQPSGGPDAAGPGPQTTPKPVPEPTPEPPAVHLLLVHGVGLHDHLSALLRVYQALRANLRSWEAPLLTEDLIPGWRLAAFDESASPPWIRLDVYDRSPRPEDVGTIYLYEVNYSAFAGVVRRNHRLDLTRLFVGFDLAVCAARQARRAEGTQSSVLTGNTPALAKCLQRFAGILTAATVPILGLPAIILRRYTTTFVATVTRFFEDVATFALDKNGEVLISAHLDRVVDAINERRANKKDRFVIAAHSLGSVVVHNFVVRHWQTKPESVPDQLITFGSPIGLLSWAWLFLDYPEMRFDPDHRLDKHYFCWTPVRTRPRPRQPLDWINVVNCVDPIATAFPVAAVHLAADPEDVKSSLVGGEIKHRFLGRTRVGQIGASHTAYLNDRDGFLEIILRAAGFKSTKPEDVSSVRTPEANWNATLTLLEWVQGLLLAAIAGIVAIYLALVARAFDEWRIFYILPALCLPRLTIGIVTFFQRLLLGGPTKRIERERIKTLTWLDASFPFRLRDFILRLAGYGRDVSPLAAGPSRWMRALIKTISFAPSLVLMSAPVWLAARWSNRVPALDFGATTSLTLVVLCAFIYVLLCAGHELVATWRQVVLTLQRDQLV